MTLTLRSAADAAAMKTKIRNEARSARITILLFTRKGLRWTVYAGLLALRVRMRGGNWQFAIGWSIRILQTAFPGIAPSDRLRFSRLQLRGSAGIAPASLSSPQGKDAQTERHFKEQKIVERGIYRVRAVEVNRCSPEICSRSSTDIRVMKSTTTRS